MNNNFETLIIVGGGSGIGLASLEYFQSNYNIEIICITKTYSDKLIYKYPNIVFYFGNIKENEFIKKISEDIKNKKILVILSAGIEKKDKHINGELNITEIIDQIETNTLSHLKIIDIFSKNKKFEKLLFIYIDSASKYIPNKERLGYAYSKKLIELIYYKNKIVKNYDLKILILGPVRTKINKDYFQDFNQIKRFIYNKIIIDVKKIPPQIGKLANSKKNIMYFPNYLIYIYRLLKLLMLK